jgi:hypothetical protein
MAGGEFAYAGISTILFIMTNALNYQEMSQTIKKSLN